MKESGEERCLNHSSLMYHSGITEKKYLGFWLTIKHVGGFLDKS